MELLKLPNLFVGRCFRERRRHRPHTLPSGQQPAAPLMTSDGNVTSLTFMVPTQDEVDSMMAAGGKISALMAWAEVDPELGAHFLTKELGIGADDHWGVMAGFQLDELNDLMSTMKYKGETLKLGVKAKLRDVYKAGRYLSGVMDDVPQPVSSSPQQMVAPIINVELPGVAGKNPQAISH